MSKTKYPEGLKDTFLCLIGLDAWPYTHAVSIKDDGTRVLETRCIKKDDYENQKGNLVDTKSNAAQAKYMTGMQGATVAAGTGALSAGTGYLGGTKAILRADYEYYKRTGIHKGSFDKGINECVAKINWDGYDSFESALKGEGSKCNFFKSLGKK